jgi:DNA anti-recombination protein RmuC
MNPTSLDKQSGAADDGHIVRIVRLETQMDNVSIALTSLQRTVEQNHRESMMRFDDMREHMEALHQKSIDRMDEIHQKSTDRMDGIHQKSIDRMDEIHQKSADRMDGIHQKSIDRMDEIHQKSTERMDGIHQKSTDRMDSYVRWMVGIMVAHIIATAGILVRTFMS